MPNYTDVLQMPGAREILVAVISSMLFVIVFLFAVLVCHKLYVEYRAQRYLRLKERYIALIGRRVFNEDVEIEKPSHYHEYEAWGDVIAEMMANCEGETVERLRKEARELGVADFFRKMVQSRSWIKRFIAIEKLGLLRLPEMADLYRSLLQTDKETHIVSKAVWALSMVADESSLAAINDVLKNPAFMSSKFAEFVYTNIIASFRERDDDRRLVALFDALKTEEHLPVILKRDIIAACGAAAFYPATATVKSYFYHFHDVTEMRIACLRALERLSADDCLRMIEEGLSDTDWRVRAVAAKSAQACTDEVLVPLKRVLDDKNYYVRMNAALSLAMLGVHGVEALTEATRADDRFARDVARYVLKR